MAIVGFHFSGVYREKLLNGKKNASVMPGEQQYAVGSPVFIYLAEGNCVEPDAVEKKIGAATIVKSKQTTLGELTLEQAVNCGYENAEALRNEMKQWFPDMTEQSRVTYVQFDLKLYG